MKLLSALFFIVVIVITCLMSGCDLKNPDQTVAPPTTSIGKDLLITEVFTLDPSKYYAYSWIELYNPTNRPITWISAVFPASGYAVGDGGTIIKTRNSGTPWTDSVDASFGNLHSIFFPQDNIAYAVGDNGTILKLFRVGTRDSIIHLTSPVTTTLNTVAGRPGGIDIQAQTAFAVGDNGVILRTVDKGATWTKQSNGLNSTKKNLRGVTMANFPAIFVVGDSGAFYSSANSGSAWAPKNIPETYRTTNFYSVDFQGQFGWAVGDNGVILATTNGGSLWLPETTHVTTSLRASFFTPRGSTLFVPQSGWVVGTNGTILKTESNGQQWTQQNSGTSAVLNSVTFVDSIHGWVFGDGGMILITDDGGNSWKQQNAPTTNGLRSSFFLPLRDTAVQYYSLQMVAQRKLVFFDPATGTLNIDVTTPIPDGTVFFVDPTGSTVNPGEFQIVTNDVNKFNNHTNLGPGKTNISSFPLAGVLGSGPNGFGLAKWNLLPSSEVRLVKIFIASRLGGSDTTITVVDVVRLGGYRPTPDDYPNNEPWPNVLPEWWSLARYDDDFGDIPSRENTKSSFFPASDPIPGWLSQQRKPR